MCELYAVCSNEQVDIKPNCNLFFQHSIAHPDGWGLAYWQKNAAIVYRSPLRALENTHYCSYLRHELWCNHAMVHIRLATVGMKSSINCHPFRQTDVSGRVWTFMHNGTAFHDHMLAPYKHLCRGDTDSEAIFYFLLAAINRATKEKGRPLTGAERIPVLEERITHLVKGNKMNLIFYDTEQMYVHTNMQGTLYHARQGQTYSFMTVPVNQTQPWQPLPLNRLLVYQNGVCVHQGKNHNHEFFEEMGEPYLEALLAKIGKKIKGLH